MSDYAPVVLWGGFLGSPLFAFIFRGSLTDNGAILLGGLIIIATFAIGMTMNIGACFEGNQCNTAAENHVLVVSAVGGAVQASAIAVVLYKLPSGTKRRMVFGLSMPISVATFIGAIWSIGPLLTLGFWVLFGWLTIKDPPLRESELTPFDPLAQGED